MKQSELALFAAVFIFLISFLPPIDWSSYLGWCLALYWLIVARREQRKEQQ